MDKVVDSTVVGSEQGDSLLSLIVIDSGNTCHVVVDRHLEHALIFLNNPYL